MDGLSDEERDKLLEGYFQSQSKPLSEEDKLRMKLQREYERRFGEQLVFDVVGHEERSYIEVLRECLRTGKPYDDGKEYDPNLKY